MSIKRINEFPENNNNLTDDDVILFMDSPSNNGVTKKASLSQLKSFLGSNNNSADLFNNSTIDLHNGGVQPAQVLQFNDSNKQSVITGPAPSTDTNAQRLIIQGQRGHGTGEGGDVYVWGGDADTNGGDIKIYAGDADSNESGYGGYINIDAGNGYNQGGNVTISAGNSSQQAGSVTISAGVSPNNNGDIFLRTSSGNTTKQWQFDNNGNSNLPEGKTLNFGQNSDTLGPPVEGGATDRIRLWDFRGSGTNYNYGIGVEPNHVWFSMDVDNGEGGFKFYSRNNQIFKISDDSKLMFPNGTTIAEGSFDNSTGGNGGISLNCAVGYELNWQGGRLKNIFIGDNSATPQPIYVDSPITFSPVTIDYGYSSTITTDAKIADMFDITLTGNTTLDNPVNPVNGKTLRWRITQDSTGNRTITLGNKFNLPSSATSPLPWSTAANKMDMLAATYHAGRDKWDIIAFVPGY